MSADEEVGSLAEEAAKLFEALQDWANESGAAPAAAAFSEVNEHLATGGKDCTYCPLCQAIALVRRTSPEVRGHLTSAAGSLLQAVAGLLEPHASQARPSSSGVERIDLDDDGSSGGPSWDAE